MAKKNTDPKKKVLSTRVFKNAADKARQKRLEGSNSPFQQRLRKAEAAGENPFEFEGKSFAARTTAPIIPDAPKVRRAKLTPRTPLLPPPGVIQGRPILSQPTPGPDAFPTPVVEPVVDKVKVKKPKKIKRNAIQGIVNNRRIKNVSPTGQRPGKRTSGNTRGNRGRRIQ